jgi:hypothetical protein
MQRLVSSLYVAVILIASPLAAQAPAPKTADSVREHFRSVHRRLLEMAKDFPEDKYDFRLRPEMRSFGAVLVHVASGIDYAAKAGKGENVNWDELDPKNYQSKAAVIALMEKSIADSEATLKSIPDERFARTVEPWLEVTEHSAEHYCLLVAYYRANALVPPETRRRQR